MPLVRRLFALALVVASARGRLGGAPRAGSARLRSVARAFAPCLGPGLRGGGEIRLDALLDACDEFRRASRPTTDTANADILLILLMLREHC